MPASRTRRPKQPKAKYFFIPETVKQ
jgi:hypothetical protein